MWHVGSNVRVVRHAECIKSVVYILLSVDVPVFAILHSVVSSDTLFELLYLSNFKKLFFKHLRICRINHNKLKLGMTWASDQLLGVFFIESH